MADTLKNKSKASGKKRTLKTLRTAVIGLGVGEAHADAYHANPSCEMAALCDIDPERLAFIGKKFAGAKQTVQPDEILDDPDIDVVSIASYDDAHYAQTVKALKNGKHVFIEKPLCMYPEEAKQIYSLLRKNPEIRMSSNLILRSSPRFQKVKALIEEGRFGKLCGIEGDYLYGRKHKITEGWRGEIDWYSVTFGGSVHIIDLMMWFAGERVIEVVSMSNRIATEGTRFRHKDLIASLLKFESGAVGKVTANFGCVHPHFHAMQVHGTKASFFHTPEAGKVYFKSDNLLQAELLADPYPGVKKGGLLNDFIQSIQQNREPIVSKKDVFDVMSVCFAIEESARHNKTVKVQYLQEP